MLTLAADLGGTRIKIGLIRNGVVVAQRVIDAQSHGGLTARLPAIVYEFEAASAEAKVLISDCDGVGMAFPCLIEPKTGRICSAIDKYPDAVNLDLRDWSRKTLNLPIVVENDANSALAGEWKSGAGKGYRSLVLMTLGTGVGTSAIIDGIPLRGQHGQAGCLGGHVTIDVDGKKCVCGNIGCVETQASSWALPNIVKAHPGFSRSALAGEASIDFRVVFQLADRGDSVAREVRDRSIRVWSAAAVTLVSMYDPEVVILGGGIMKSPGPIVQMMESYINQHAWLGWGKIRVLPGELGDSAALLGLHHLFEHFRPE